jgi:glucose-6-phosphate-specific signal transduction histidine kinase
MSPGSVRGRINISAVAHVRNIVIILAIAAVVVAVPGGGTGASVATQAISLLFLASLGWFAALMYRQHRVDLYALGDRRRMILYGAAAVATLTLTGTSKLWATSIGSIVWLVLLAGAIYAVVAVFLSSRRAA